MDCLWRDAKPLCGKKRVSFFHSLLPRLMNFYWTLSTVLSTFDSTFVASKYYFIYHPVHTMQSVAIIVSCTSRGSRFGV